MLLKEPESMELHTKPSAERKNNFVCTGNPKKHFFIQHDKCKVAHRNNESNKWFVKERQRAASRNPVYENVIEH